MPEFTLTTPAEREVLRNVYQAALDTALEKAAKLEYIIESNREYVIEVQKTIEEDERELQVQRNLIEDVLELARREGIELVVPTPPELTGGDDD